MWTEEEKQKFYIRLMTDPDSEFQGCVDFAKCYISKLENIVSYEDTENPIKVDDDTWSMIDVVRTECITMFPCRDKIMKSRKTNRKDTVQTVGILLYYGWF